MFHYSIYDAVCRCFSISTGAGGCAFPISARAFLVDVALCLFSDNPPNYASVSDAMTFLMVLHSTCTGFIYGFIAVIGLLDFVPKKKYPPALIRALGYEM